MSDERLRELERRWKESGSSEDEAAYLRALDQHGEYVQAMKLMHAKIEAKRKERAAQYKAKKAAEEEKAFIANLQAVAEATVEQNNAARRMAQLGNEEEETPPSD